MYYFVNALCHLKVFINLLKKMQRLAIILCYLFSTSSFLLCSFSWLLSFIRHHLIPQFHQNFEIKKSFSHANRMSSGASLNYYKHLSINISNVNTLPAFHQLNLLQSSLFQVGDASSFSYTMGKPCLKLPITKCTCSRMYD